MQPPIIVNESSSMEVAGAIDIFATAEDAETYLEPWYVDEPHFTFDGEGRRLKFVLEDENLKLVAIEDTPSHQQEVRFYLVEFLKSIANARGWDFVGVKALWCENATLEELGRKALKFATR